MKRYTRSLARDRLDAEISVLQRTVRAAHSAKSTVPPTIRNATLVFAMVRSCAALEGYVHDLMHAWVSGINASSANAAMLPAQLRAHLLNDVDALVAPYRHFVAHEDESRLFSRLADAFDDPRMALFDGAALVPPLAASDVYRTSRFPSPKNLRKVLRRVGLESPFKSLDKILKSGAEMMLQSFLDVRNSLAHESAAVGVNDTDVQLQLVNLIRFVGALDRLMWLHNKDFPGPAHWR